MSRGLHQRLREEVLHIGLNLLFIIPGQNGGTQVYSESLINALAALDQKDTFTVFVSEEGRTLELPAQPNFHKVACPVHAARREARYAYEQIAFPRLLRRYNLDLLHSLGYVCPLRAPCPSLVTIHDLNYLAIQDSMPRGKRLFLGWFVAQSAQRADHILTVSQFSKKEIEHHLHVPDAKITVTHEGPRAPAARPSESWKDLATQYQMSQPYLIAFGSLSSHKNMDRLIRAFARIHTQVPHTLLLAGHMTPGARLQAEIAALGISDRIKITGYIPDAHVMPLLEHADLFVFPSRYEGFGLPVLEAQTAGVAVACSTAASLPEVAGDGAAFFDPASTEEMGRVILDCLRDPARRAALIEKGRANVARFSWARTAAETLGCYEKLRRRGGQAAETQRLL